jgi:chemotaxis protein CheD
MNQKVTYHLEPGFIYAHTEGAIIRTVLGSCVAVCLWDSDKMIGGMNHFLYPAPSSGEPPTARFGTVATGALIRLMKELGSHQAAMSAQIFGGAKSHDHPSAIGPKNIETAREVLLHKGIPVVSEDVGGTMGRKVLFDTRNGHAAVLKVRTLRQEDWIDQA